MNELTELKAHYDELTDLQNACIEQINSLKGDERKAKQQELREITIKKQEYRIQILKIVKNEKN